LKVEKNFLEQHLIQWVSLLSKKINSEDKSGFYSAIAELTEGWVSFDYEQITMQEV
jgi:TorA maturation chaperone TorD